ncbi:unnamed protein product, partial [Urochloa humidicola]
GKFPPRSTTARSPDPPSPRNQSRTSPGRPPLASLSRRSIAEAAAAATCTESPFAKAAAAAGGDPAVLAILWSPQAADLAGSHSQTDVQQAATSSISAFLESTGLPRILAALQSDGSLECSDGTTDCSLC